MTSTNATDRARLAEDDYFRRKDAELIEQARLGRQQATVDSLAAIEKRALADAVGVHDDLLVGRLHEAGFRAGNAALLDWLPAIDVAWVDSTLDVRERHELRTHIAADPRADGPSVALMTEFLFIQPSPELMEAARNVLRRQLAMEPALRDARLDTILERCEQVAEASGGVWIVGSVSAAEHRRIAAVRAGLADAAADADSVPAEFPH